MIDTDKRSYTAFGNDKKIASGSMPLVALRVKKYIGKHERVTVLFFDDLTGQQVEVDLRGSEVAVLRRLQGLADSPSVDKKIGPGRPKLGVVSREISLLPRHWEWLALQSGGASVTLRKLVEEAKKTNQGKDRIRQAQEATYKFMAAIAGNLPLYEEVLRAFFAHDLMRFKALIAPWPKDIRTHALKMAEPAFQKK